jgi:hypothetical protein
MVSRSADHTEVQAGAQRRASAPGALHADHAAIDQASSLARSARVFAARSHARQRRHSDGAPFIEHPLEVAGLLRGAGCSDVVVAAGLLHDIVENTHVSLDELSARFGAPVAGLVRAVSDDPSLQSYRQRKRMLREQVRDAGGDAALIFAADKIAKVRELPDRVRRDMAGVDATARGHRARSHYFEHDHQMRLEHYRQSLVMLQQVIPGHPLVTRLLHELDTCSITYGPLSA